MGQLLIRNLDDEVIDRLKVRASLAGQSLEQTAREILKAASPLSAREKVKESRRLRSAFASVDWDTRSAVRWGRDDEFHDLEKKFDTP